VNCNIGVLSARRLALVTLPVLMGNTFVIKAHSGPTSTSRLLQRLGLLRITFIYRDPRDAMLSAYEYGQRAVKKGHPNAFSHLTDFQKTQDFILDYIRIWEKWMREKHVLIARYEDLLSNYDDEVMRLVRFLQLDDSNPELRKVIDQYHPGDAQGQQGLHFYKGKIGRFREVYSAEEQRMLRENLGLYIRSMGYEV
jgi:hypothetical protein